MHTKTDAGTYQLAPKPALIGSVFKRHCEISSHLSKLSIHRLLTGRQPGGERERERGNRHRNIYEGRETEQGDLIHLKCCGGSWGRGLDLVHPSRMKYRMEETKRGKENKLAFDLQNEKMKEQM